MNLELAGNAICKIINPTQKIEKTISIEANPKLVRNSFQSIKLKSPEYIQVIPNKKLERQNIYVFGQSGAGKSHWCKGYAEQYHKMFKNNRIYLFSSLGSDKTLDSLGFLEKVQLNDTFLQTVFSIEDFENTLCIFDDTDCIINRAIKKKITEILHMILETGRHVRCSVIYTSHVGCKGMETRIVLNEAHVFTLFPKTMGLRNLKYILEQYLGMDKEQIEKIKNLNSRWISIFHTYPQVVAYENGAYIL